MFNKINLKLILNHHINILIVINYNNGGREIVKEIVMIIRTNENKKVKVRYTNKLIIFIYYLNLFLTLSHTIKFKYI